MILDDPEKCLPLILTTKATTEKPQPPATPTRVRPNNVRKKQYAGRDSRGVVEPTTSEKKAGPSYSLLNDSWEDLLRWHPAFKGWSPGG